MQSLSFLICKVRQSFPSSQDWWGSDALTLATISDTLGTLSNVRSLPPCPKQLPAQLLSRLCLGKKRKESGTQTWPTFSAKSLVFQEGKRGSPRDVLSQLARTQPDVLLQKLLPKGGSWDPFFQSDGVSPLATWTLEAFVKIGISGLLCQF